jgi:hypothetical protein
MQLEAYQVDRGQLELDLEEARRSERAGGPPTDSKDKELSKKVRRSKILQQF